jgi:hypothetical protein
MNTFWKDDDDLSLKAWRVAICEKSGRSAQQIKPYLLRTTDNPKIIEHSSPHLLDTSDRLLVKTLREIGPQEIEALYFLRNQKRASWMLTLM